MIEQAFEVATEFRFDIGSALINTKALGQAVDDLSSSANKAMQDLSYLAGGLVAHLGLGSGGIISALKRAVDVSEEFQTGMFGFMNSIDSNMTVLTGTIHTFNDRLATSKMLMSNIGDEADKFGLNPQQLAAITQMVASPLAARGRAGKNYTGATSMARNMMLTSEAVGLPQGMGSEMLVRGLTTGALGGKLFERLANTQAFRDQRISRPEQIGAGHMNDTRRIDLLTKALEQLGGNSEWLAMRVQTLQFQFSRLKNRLDQLLRPIGDAIKAPIILLFAKLNDWLKTYGPQLGAAMASLITQFTQDPKGLLIGLMQLSHLKSDLGSAFKFAGLFQMFRFIIPILKSLGLINGGLISGIFYALGAGIRYIVTFLGSGFFLGALRLIGVAIASFLPEFLIFAAVFQTLSRAKAKARVGDVTAGAGVVSPLIALFARMSRALSVIFKPITKILDMFADMLAPLFAMKTYLTPVVWLMTQLADCLDGLADIILAVSGEFIALVDALTESTKIKNILGGGKKMASVFDQTFNKSLGIFQKNHPFLSGQAMPNAQTKVENNNHIEARFDMREQLEPDRIAFAVTTHLKKLAISATGARGQSIASGFSGSQQFRGNNG